MEIGELYDKLLSSNRKPERGDWSSVCPVINRTISPNHGEILLALIIYHAQKNNDKYTVAKLPYGISTRGKDKTIVLCKPEKMPRDLQGVILNYIDMIKLMK